MQLPKLLKQTIEQLLEHTPIAELSQASQRLSKRYRAETRDGKMHLNQQSAAFAYLAARFPATYAAIYTTLNDLSQLLPDFLPKSQLDVGAGPGTAALAAQSIFSSLDEICLLEQSNDITNVGKTLTDANLYGDVKWQQVNILQPMGESIDNADLVTLGYVLDEISPIEQDVLIDKLWNKTQSILLIIEPGTPAGWQRLMRQRQRLLDKGAHLIAPCPHQFNCPIHQPDWCHFSVRVERSRLHRLTKQGEVPFEDEKFSYLIFSREKFGKNYQRILAKPKNIGGGISLKICNKDGQVIESKIEKRKKQVYKSARKCDWGDFL